MNDQLLSAPRRALMAGVVYFALVFAVGFVLGVLRVLWAVPQFGERTAELLEMPLMLGVMIGTARWTMQRWAVPASLTLRMQSGLTALACLVLVEVLFVLQLRGLQIGDYLASRDPISGTVYLLMLALFAVMPALVARSESKEELNDGTI